MRVLEISNSDASAAYCGKLLARWGAEVIKAEPADRDPPSEALHAHLNGGKRRVSLDYRVAEDRASIERLAKTCELVIADLPARDTLDHRLLDLGANGVTRAVISITPFGLDGPYRDFEATAATLLALGGYTWLMGDPGRAPLTMPGEYPWYQAGTFAYIAGLAAMLAAPEAPRRVEVSVFECLAGLHQFTDTMWQAAGRVRSRHGNRWENLCPTTLLPCADGWFGVNVLQNFWAPFALMIGHAEFAEEHAFATNEGRMLEQDEVEATVVEALGGWPKERIFREGQETWRVPVGAAATLEELLNDPHLEARGFWRSLGGSGLRTAGSPFRFIGEEPPEEAAPAALGADTAEVRAGLGAPETASGGAIIASSPRPIARPLEGVRILDLTRIWSGPLATRILGDLGADIVKIEAHTNRGPAVPAGQLASNNPEARGEHPWNLQALFNKLSRNKRSVAIDLKANEGREAFLALVAASDVVIENFSARAMPGLGLGYQALCEANPSIIYLTMPAFGRDGPYRDYIGLGPSIEPMTGLTALMGYSEAEPRVTSTAVTDAMAGTTAAAALLTALERRSRTGAGALLDLSQHEVGVAFLGEQFIEYQLRGAEPARLGNGHREHAPHGVYRCRGEDEWIAIAARDDEEWRALCALAAQAWDLDARFAGPEPRRAHALELDAVIEAWTAQQEKRALMAALQARRVPAGVVLSPPEWLSDPHLEARGYFVELDHLEAGRGRWDGSPLRFDGERGYEAWVAAPLLGEHNVEALAGLGVSRSDIEHLQRIGILADRPPA